MRIDETIDNMIRAGKKYDPRFAGRAKTNSQKRRHRTATSINVQKLLLDMPTPVTFLYFFVAAKDQRCRAWDSNRGYCSDMCPNLWFRNSLWFFIFLGFFNFLSF